MNYSLDFLVIGAQKCATTWIFDCLKDHPEVHLPSKKRDAAYIGGQLYSQHGSEWYFKELGQPLPHQKKGDVSVDYVFDPNSPAAVHSLTPQVKLIVSLRDPIDRAISAYYYLHRVGLIPDDSLEQALEKAFNLYHLDQFDSDLDYYCASLLKRGFYDDQLRRYLDFFSPDQFLVFLYEEIDHYPLECMSSVYRFIGVNPDFYPPHLESEPKRNTYLPWLIYFERIGGKSRLTRKLSDLANQLLYRLRIRNSRPELPASLIARLNSLFRPHLAATRLLIATMNTPVLPASAQASPWLP